MKKKLKKLINKLFSPLLLIFTLFLTTCDNFMVDNANFKDTLKEEVIVANADELEVFIQAEAGTGTTSPSGYYTAKVGVSFNVSLQEDTEYGFIRWAGYDATEGTTELTGVVSFESPTSLNTKAEMLQFRPNTLIRPICERRLSVTDQEPGGLYTEVVRNYPITIQFNKDIDPASVTDEAITIEGKLNGSYDEYVSVESFFQDPVITGQYMTINVASPLTSGWRIRVTLDKSLYDTSGLTMTEDYSWQYLTNSSIDITAPVIAGITGATGTSPSSLDTIFAGSVANDHRIGNENMNFYLSVSASDISGVQNISITEEQTMDEAGAAVSNAFSSLVVYYPGLDYTLFEPQTTGDGVIELTITVSDVNGNISLESLYSLVKDTTPPTVSDNTAAIGYTENSLYVNDMIHFTNTGLVDANAAAVRSSTVNWRFAFDNSQTYHTDWADSAGGAAISLQALGMDDGEDYPVYVQLADDQMNASPWTLLSSFNVDLESEAPDITAVTITNAETYSSTEFIGSTTASLNITGTDNLSGIASYYLSESSTVPTAASGGWTSLTPSTSVDFTADYSGLSEGSHSLYLWLMDRAGNISAGHTIGPFTVDTTGPGTPTVPSDPASSGVLYQSGSTYYTQDGSLTFTFSASDGSGSGVAGFNTNNSTSIEFASNLTINAGESRTIYAVDNLGNVSSGLAIGVEQDTAAPDTPSTSDPTPSSGVLYHTGNTYYTRSSSLEFTFTSNDNGSSGFAGFNTDGSSTVAFTSTLVISAGQTKTVYAVDKVGNVSSSYLSVSVVQDTATPDTPSTSDPTPSSGVLYHTGNTYYSQDDSLEFTFTSNDNGSSGFAGFNTDGSSTVAFTSTLVISAGQTKTVYAVDKVGNVSSSYLSVSVVQDTAAPDTPSTSDPTPSSGVLYHTGNTYYSQDGSLEFTFTSNDNGSSGFAGFNTDGSSTVAFTSTLVISAGQTKMVYAVDRVGNVSSSYLSVSVEQDTAAPDIPSFDTNDAEYGYYDSAAGIYYIAVNNTDAVFISDDGTGSGIAGFADAVDGSPASFVSLNKGTSYSIYAFDNVGHVSAAFAIDVVKDATKIP